MYDIAMFNCIKYGIILARKKTVAWWVLPNLPSTFLLSGILNLQTFSSLILLKQIVTHLFKNGKQIDTFPDSSKNIP